MWGVRDEYSSEEFYNKDNKFDSEKTRINNIFQKSEQLGICVQIETLSIETIQAELVKNCVCIILVDASKLNGVNLDNDLNDDFTLCTESENNKSICCFLNNFSKL
jgi:hypothetical protein